MISLSWLIYTVVDIYVWLLLGRVILGWLIQFNIVNARNQFVNIIGGFFYQVTEPALMPIRRVVPLLGGIDVSPVVLVLLLIFLRSLFFEYVM